MFSFFLSFLRYWVTAISNFNRDTDDANPVVQEPDALAKPVDDLIDHDDSGVETESNNETEQDDDRIDHGEGTLAQDDDDMDLRDEHMESDDGQLDHTEDNAEKVDDHMNLGDDDLEPDDSHMHHGRGNAGEQDDDRIDLADDHMEPDDGQLDLGDYDAEKDDDDMNLSDDGNDEVEPDDSHMHHGGDDMVLLPKTPEDIAAFVADVRTSPEIHMHDMGSSKMDEHMAAMKLVPRNEATHIAIADGKWGDSDNWHTGEVPGDDAAVLIPDGIHIIYDEISDARLFTVRVDGHLDFATDTDSTMIVDTFVVSPSGELTIGTATDPVNADVNVDIIFANNGQIDTDWDPTLLSRGMIAHGTVEIHGTEKDSHEKVVDDPKAGDTSVKFGETPEGWAIGDKIVIAGTHYEGYYRGGPEGGYSSSEDEVRVITQIEDGQVFFDNPLAFDHDAPRDDLKTSVANYTRNVSFETEDADLAEIYERGHVMFMHNDDVDVRYAEFHELGRTDKSETALNASEFESLEFGTNIKGRYGFHFHRAGQEDLANPAIAVGNAVYGSPGWGFVHHDSNAVLENNATFDTFGAGYVAESGNETGAWTDNIAILAQGKSWADAKLGNDLKNFDLGQTGDGFWFQGRMVESTDNIAVSVNHGFVYFHRGATNENAKIPVDAENSQIPGALWYDDDIPVGRHPILEFSGNEAFAANRGLYVLKASPQQDHDVHSVLEDFTAWSVKSGADLSYTGHYVLKDFDLVGKEGTSLSSAKTGISIGINSTDITIVDSNIEDFDTGINLDKGFASHIGGTSEDHNFTIVNPTFVDVDNHYGNYDPQLDTILGTDDVPNLTPDLQLDGPLTYKEGWPDPDARQVEITGIKTDSLGKTPFPDGIENYNPGLSKISNVLPKEGYYTTKDGQDYFDLDIYFSDRLTGDIYVETHPVLLDENIPFDVEWGGWYYDVPFNGVRELDSQESPDYDAATLWGTLTDGQLVLSEDALEMAADDEERDLERELEDG